MWRERQIHGHTAIGRFFLDVAVPRFLDRLGLVRRHPSAARPSLVPVHRHRRQAGRAIAFTRRLERHRLSLRSGGPSSVGASAISEVKGFSNGAPLAYRHECYRKVTYLLVDQFLLACYINIRKDKA